MKVRLNSGIILAAIALCLLFLVPRQILAEEDPELTEIQELIHKADSLVQAKQLDTAIVLGKLALKKAKNKFTEFDTIVASASHVLGKCFYYQASYAECESLYNKALFIREKVLGPEHPDVATALDNLGLLYWRQGKYAEAESLCRQALSIREKARGPDHPEVATSLNSLAKLHLSQGKYPEAEPLFRRALDILEKTLGPDHTDVAASLHNLAILYVNQGKYVEAQPLFERARDILGKNLEPDHPDMVASLKNLAILYRIQGKFAEAEPLFKRVLEIREKALGPHHPDLGASLNSLANLYYYQGKYTEAEPLYNRVLEIKEKTRGPNHLEVAGSLHNLANLYYDQGKYKEAEPLHKRALDIFEETLGLRHPDGAWSLSSLAVLYGSLGEVDQSLAYYRKLQQSRQHFIDYVFSYASEDQKMRYIEEYPLISHSLLSFSIMTNSDEPKSCALEMILKGKAAIIDAVSAEKQIAFCSYDDEIQKKAERHAEVCGEISTVTLAGVEKLDPEIYRGRLQTLYSKKDSLETELSKSCAEFKDELAARRFAIADVANALPQGSVLWEFVRYEPYDFKKVGSDKERTGPPRYLAFTLDDRGNVSLTDLGETKEIDSLVSLARERIYKAKAGGYPPSLVESERELNEITSKLYEIIFAPLESYLGGGRDIFVSPDGQLNLLPFEILPCPDGKYAVEKFGISYLSSGRDLLRFQGKQKRNDWALVMANPDFDLSGETLAEQRDKTLRKSDILSLAYEPSRGVSGCLSERFGSIPYTREEGESILRALGKIPNLRTQSYYAGDALEEVLKGMTTAPRFLHLATHGFFCEDVDLTEGKVLENPLLRSGLALTGANRLKDENRKDESQTEDGILTAFEASGLNLIGTELVTLSACETGIGEIKNGEGVYGLRRAFQHAGARSVVMSLWRVPDEETRDLMDDFYRNWFTGRTKKEALRQSALKILSACRDKYGVAHPLFWGGFVMVGDPN